nr:hypothetical transcript [Hymenolepis microstoma]
MNMIYFLLFFATLVLAQSDSTTETAKPTDATLPSGATKATEGGSGDEKTTTSKSSLLQPEFFVLAAATYFARLYQFY